MTDERPIGETIEEKIRELGEEIRELRKDFDEFRESFLALLEENERTIAKSEQMIRDLQRSEDECCYRKAEGIE